MELRSASEPGVPLGLALIEGEGQTIEFMEGMPANARELAKEIAAFSTSNDGSIFLGVRDDGSICGLPGMETPPQRDALVSRVAGIASGAVQPAAAISLSFKVHEGSVVARVFVHKGHHPVYFASNVPYVRHLDQSRPAGPDEVQALYRRSS